MKKIELINKIKFDLKCDKIMSILTAGNVIGAIVAFGIGLISFIWIVVHGLHFLLWYNAYLITQRNLQMMEVKK